ncbi:MAG: NAD(P)-dependent oxidoreductase [Bacteroidales bacterium]|nr:NAD(P)-dependent oxidoreductase [Bacteroidales bacterium]
MDDWLNEKGGGIMKIGFIGLGIMGSRMAENLLKSGYELNIYNRTESKAKALIDQGAIWKDTPAEVAKSSEVLITMLANPEAVENTAFSENGFINHFENKLWMDSSTVNPTFTKKMVKEANLRNIRFVDAPVAGSLKPAQEGNLIFLVGGDKQDVNDLTPLMEIMGKKIVHAGQNSTGTSLKMVVNLMLAQSMLAFSEAVHLGTNLGIDRKFLMEFLANAAVTAPFLSGKVHKIADEDYFTEFPLKWMQKDLQLVAQSAYETETALPSGNVAKELYQLAKSKGLADEDFSAIFKLLGKE